MSVKLQIALDDIDLDASIALLHKIHEDIDIIEVGTPMMMKYGMKAVSALKKSFPHKIILCDTKIMDAGYYEASLAYDAGADIVTALALTDKLTIADIIKLNKETNKKVLADMICVKDFKEKVEELEKLGVDIIAIHTGVDQQESGVSPLDDLKEIKKYVTKSKIAVAGGINLKTIDEYLEHQPDIIIVGSGITKAPDPESAAKQLKIKIKEYQCNEH